MTEIRYDDAADLSLIQSRRVAVIGDWSDQGHAHALNLRDSGVDVRVGLPAEHSELVSAASDEGLPVLAPAQATAEADVIMLLPGDDVVRRHFETDIAPNLAGGDALIFRGGFNVSYGLVTPPPTVDVGLVAPAAPGELVRRQFVDGKGVPCLVAVHADVTGQAWQLVLSYARAVGLTRAGAFVSSFAEEAQTGLFGEQAMAGGATALALAGFEALTERGCAPEVAYLACLQRLKLVVDELVARGLAGVHDSMPDGAAYGALTRGPRVVSPTVRDDLRKILAEIVDGTFAGEWVAEDGAGRPNLRRLSTEAEAYPFEQVGRELRTLMSWLD